MRRSRNLADRFGPAELETLDVLALVLDSGRSASAVYSQAATLLRASGGLAGLGRMEAETLNGPLRLGRAVSRRVGAALELSRRLQVAVWSAENRPLVSDPRVAAGILMPRLGHLRREHFGILLLDSRNRLERESIISVGSLNGSLVHPREVFRHAVIHAVASIILFHNHPSGDSTPSREDLAVTRRLVEAGEILGVGVLDHLVLGRGNYTSLKNEGLM